VPEPGGELRGTTIVRRAGIRQEAFIRAMQVGGVFGPSLTLAGIESWLADAGPVKISTSRHGALAYFPAHRRSADRIREPGVETN
jgi:hypothetical protein